METLLPYPPRLAADLPLAACSPRAPRTGRGALRGWPWHSGALRLVALQIVLTLGLLSPLICVIHCAIHSGSAAHVTPAAGHGHQGHHASAATPAGHNHQTHPGSTAGPAQGVVVACAVAQNHAPSSEDPAIPTPRALYELLGGAVVLLAAAAGPSVALARRGGAPLCSLAPTPPTPPPRLA